MVNQYFPSFSTIYILLWVRFMDGCALQGSLQLYRPAQRSTATDDLQWMLCEDGATLQITYVIWNPVPLCWQETTENDSFYGRFQCFKLLSLNASPSLSLSYDACDTIFLSPIIPSSFLMFLWPGVSWFYRFSSTLSLETIY